MLKLSDFNQLTAKQKQEAINNLISSQSKNIKDLELTIMRYESIYDMSTQDMLNSVNAKTMQETNEIVHWSFLYQVVQYLKG